MIMVKIEKLEGGGYLVTSSNQNTTHPGMMSSCDKRAAIEDIDNAFEKARELFDEENKKS
jgi:hypothetical protein